MKPIATRLIATLVCPLILFSTKVQAVNTNDTWTGAAGTGNWSDAGNWAATGNQPPVGGIVVGPADVPVFGTVGAGGATLTNDLVLTAPNTNFGGLTFNPGAPSFTLKGNQIVSIGGIVDNSTSLETINFNIIFPSTHTLGVTAGGTLAIKGVISGAGGATKTGGGTVIFPGLNPQTYTGATAVNGGTLTLDFVTGAPGPNLINKVSALQLGGGTLNLLGTTSIATSSNLFASTVVNAGQSTVSGTNSAGVAFAALTSAAGGTVQFIGPATTNAAANVAATATLTTTTVGGGVFGAVGGFGAGKNGAFGTVGLYDFASTSLANGTAGTSPFTLIGGSQVAGFYQSTGITTTTAAYDVPAVGGVNTLGNATGSPMVRFNTPSALTLTFTVTTANGIQGILLTPSCGANNETFTGGGLQFVRSSTGGASYGVIWQNNILGYLNFNSVIEPGRLLLGGGGNTCGLVQSGPGTVVYGGVNDYDLATFLNGGFSMVTANNGFGRPSLTQTVNLNGGTVVGNASFTMDNAGLNLRPIFLGNNGGGLAATAGNVMTIDGVLSGAGALTIGIPASSANGNTDGLLPGSGPTTANAAVNATGVVSFNSAGNTYSGLTTILGGATLRINSEFALGGANYAGLVITNGTLQYNSTLLNAVTDISLNTVSLNGPATIDANGNTINLAGSIGNGGAGSLTVASTIGGGKLTVQGANLYTGGTTVSSGSLLVNNTTGSGTGSGNATVLNGATLGGTGIISGNVTWLASSLASFTQGSPLTVSGSVTANNNSVTANIPGAPLGAGNYRLMNYTAAGSSGNFNSTPTITGAGLAAGATATVTNGNGVVNLVVVQAGVAATWTNDVNGNWTDATKWSSNPSVPGNAGDAATLGVGTALRTVTLNANETVGGITFTNDNSFAVANAGSTLTLDNSGSGATVIVLAGTANSLSPVVSLNDNATIAVNSGKSLTLSNTVVNTGGAKTLTVSGAGTTVLSGANTYGPSAGSTGTTLTGGGVVQVGNNSALGAGDVNVTGNYIVKAGVANLNLANNLAVANTTTATLDNNGNNATLPGVISGNGSFAKSGGGSLTVNGANTYAGSTTVNGGTLNLSADTSLGTAPGGIIPNSLVLNGGGVKGNGTFSLSVTRSVGIGATTGTDGTNALMDVASGQALTVGGAIASAGNTGANSLTVNSGAGNNGTLVLAGAGTFTGATVISNGVLSLANSLALQNSTLNYSSGTLDFTTLTAATLGGFFGSQPLVLTNDIGGGVTLTIGNNGSSTTYGTNFSGSGALTKVGAGTFILAGSNSYAGATTVSGGLLVLTNGGQISGGAVNVNNNGQFNVYGALTAGGLCSLNNAGTVTAKLYVLPGATANLNAGIDGLGNANAPFLTDVSGATLTTTTVRMSRTSLSYTTEPTGGDTGSGLYVHNSGNVTLTGNLEMGQTSGGNSSVNTRMDSGSLTIGGSVLLGINNGGRWSIVDVSGGTLNVTNAGTSLTLGSPLVGNQTFVVRGGTANVERIQMGLTTNGTSVVNLSGGSLYLGSGGIALGANAGAGLVSTIRLTSGLLGANADWSSTLPMILGGATIQAAAASSVAHNITLGGALSGTTLTKTGAGTLMLAGTNNYTGATTVNTGTLLVSGVVGNSAATVNTGGTLCGTGLLNGTATVAAGGSMVPGLGAGDTSTLTISNTLALAGNAEFFVNRTNAQNSSRVSGLASVSYGGSLTVSNLADALQNGDTFTLFSAAANSGSFTATNLPALGSGLKWNWNPATGQLSVAASVSTTPTSITNTVNGSTLTLAWPADHIGWRLQVQTNNLATGLNSNWSDVSGSTVTNSVNQIMNAASGSVFYRLLYP